MLKEEFHIIGINESSKSNKQEPTTLSTYINIRDSSTVFEHIVLYLMNLIYIKLYFVIMSLAQLKDSHFKTYMKILGAFIVRMSLRTLSSSTHYLLCIRTHGRNVTYISVPEKACFYLIGNIRRKEESAAQILLRGKKMGKLNIDYRI